ncbi:hypothetical protein ACRALDRAFT_208065 [Sodiomyces alcalophilus JCM 7366]|uniref:uncharacterized protein n=1 Tax=Sodiomyces alcalophilus JCM 7366 TaxID=591952 RepID=UPI0039B46930
MGENPTAALPGCNMAAQKRLRANRFGNPALVDVKRWTLHGQNPPQPVGGRSKCKINRQRLARRFGENQRAKLRLVPDKPMLKEQYSAISVIPRGRGGDAPWLLLSAAWMRNMSESGACRDPCDRYSSTLGSYCDGTWESKDEVSCKYSFHWQRNYSGDRICDAITLAPTTLAPTDSQSTLTEWLHHFIRL